VLGRGLLAMLMAACLFGLGAVLAKPLGESFDPFFVSWLALLGGGFCILAFQMLRRKPLLSHLTRAGWVDLFLFASIGTALPLLCVIAGLPQTGAITGGFLLQLQAPAALLFALVLLKETVVWKHVAGIGLLLAGSLLVILRDVRSSLPPRADPGELLLLLAAVGIGFSYIPGKRLTQYGDALQINLLRLFVGSILLLPFLAFHVNGLVAPLSWSLISVLILYIVANFGLGYVLLQSGLALLPAWTASAILQTTPLFTTVFALLLLHESLTFLQVIGGGVILAGGFLIISSPSNDPRAVWDRPVLLKRAWKHS
jgi:drug/metabolite transporter (DMT)-like permease